MGHLKPGHIVEAILWLVLVGFLFIYSFEFDKEIEIYQYGASAWPRAILLLIAVAAIGQLLTHWKTPDGAASNMASNMKGQASAENSAGSRADGGDDDGDDAVQDSSHNSAKWYAWTFFLIAIPFAYMIIPEWLAAVMGWEKSALHTSKLACAAILIALYLIAIRGNHVGGILTLPILFAAFLQDFGFYAMAPVFILGVMYLMGERRYREMINITLGIVVLLFTLFVSLLYVGLPTGNISPFYEFGTTIVNILQ